MFHTLPDELVNKICCMAVKLKSPNPFAEQIKTLNMLGEVIQRYKNAYQEDAMDWLSIDLDKCFPDENDDTSDWGVHRKWMSLTPEQRRFFNDSQPELV